mmetsp:Transcript_34145/g.75267  ORF Transcript_34145/g.75267 Transcript_34145/m.75267 type:complete len:103 (+) Transcript_34145:473-781(+)
MDSEQVGAVILRAFDRHSLLPIMQHPAPSTQSQGTLDWGSLRSPDLSQSILFTNDFCILGREEARIPQAADEIEFFDDGRVVEEVGGYGNRDRPMTAVNGRG